VWASLNGSAWLKASQVIKCRLYRNAAWTITNGGLCPFDTYAFGQTWNLSNGVTFTCPVAGDYFVATGVGGNYAQNNYLVAQIRKNGAGIMQGFMYNGGIGTANVYPTVSGIFEMSPGDTSDVYLVTNQAGGTGLTGNGVTWIVYKFLSAQ
jgi:hypothetical protein